MLGQLTLDVKYFHSSRIRCAFSFIIRGEIVNYAFLKTVISTVLKKTFLFCLISLWRFSWIFKMAVIIIDILPYCQL